MILLISLKLKKTLSTDIQFELNSVYYSYNSIVSINNKRATLSHSLNKKDEELLKYYKIICPNAYV